MSVYIVASIAIRDPEEYGRYQAGFLEVFTKYRGEILAVSDESEARRWYEAPEYHAIAQHRWRASTGTVIALKGL